MNLKKYKHWLPYILLGVIVLFFWLFRIKGLVREELIYTYDQARDFLAGARIIINRDPVFFGPTTGIGGLFHGAWWYYIVAATFLILGSDPINYYYVILLTQTISILIFYFIGKRLFGEKLALIGALNITVSEYFIGTSLFPSNHIFAMPSFLIYCLTLGLILKNFSDKKYNNLILLFIFGLSYGFVAEFELAFGILLAPATILLIIIIKELRKQLNNPRAILAYLFGIIVPFMPRILFELKNGFIQTQLLLNFFIKPKLFTPRTYSESFNERIGNFSFYLSNTFASDWFIRAIIILGIVALSYFGYRLYRKQVSYKIDPNSQLTFRIRYFVSLVILLLSLFILSVGYRDTFWNYYFEGIQYGILILSLVGMSIIIDTIPKFSNIIIGVFVCILLIPFSQRLNGLDFGGERGPNGLHLQRKIVADIVESQKNERIFCARVYVPPVIPYTYDYLWLNHYLKKDVETPRYDFINNKCWYIIEPEQKGYEFRIDKWKELNIPKNATPVKGSEKTVNGISIIKYQLSKEK